MKSVSIENTSGHPISTRVTDENGEEVRVKFPIVVEITDKGMIAVLRVPITKLVVGGHVIDSIKPRPGVTERYEVGSEDDIAQRVRALQRNKVL